MSVWGLELGYMVKYTPPLILMLIQYWYTQYKQPQYSKKKVDIQKAIKKSHHEYLMGQIEGLGNSKIFKKMIWKNLGYFNKKNLNEARMKFKIRTKMLG